MATFRFHVAPGAGHPQVFQLVAEGFCWFAGTSFEISSSIAADGPVDR